MRKHNTDFRAFTADAFSSLDDDKRFTFCFDYLMLKDILPKLDGAKCYTSVRVFNNPDIVEDVMWTCSLDLEGDEYTGRFLYSFDDLCNIFSHFEQYLIDDALLCMVSALGLDLSDALIVSGFLWRFNV